MDLISKFPSFLKFSQIHFLLRVGSKLGFGNSLWKLGLGDWGLQRELGGFKVPHWNIFSTLSFLNWHFSLGAFPIKGFLNFLHTSIFPFNWGNLGNSPAKRPSSFNSSLTAKVFFLNYLDAILLCGFNL